MAGDIAGYPSGMVTKCDQSLALRRAARTVGLAEALQLGD
jgi:hypothetical protein